MYKLSLVSIWNYKKTKETYVQFHTHNFYELVYYRFGSGSTNIGNKRYAFKADTFVIIPPNTEHDETYETSGEVYCVGFLSDCILPLSFYDDDNHKIFNIIRLMYEEVRSQLQGYEDMIIAKLTELYVEIMRIEKHSSAGVKNFEFVINYIHENYYEKIELRSLAEQLNLSYDYFQHKFKSVTGYSPQRFVIKRRLDVSKKFLFDSSLNCTEIAYRCGFSNSAQFSMMFKKEYGVSPLRFRKEYTENSANLLR